MFIQKKEIELDQINYSIDLVPNKQTVTRLLGKKNLNKEQIKRLKGKPLRFSAVLFKEIYLAIQEKHQKENIGNKEVSIEIAVPQFEKYTLLTDTKKISKASFLTLLQESIAQEDDLEKASSLYQKVVNDFYNRPTESTFDNPNTEEISPPSVLENEQFEQPSDRERTSNQDSEDSVNEQVVSPQEDSLQMIEVVQEETPIFESDQPIKIEVDYLKTKEVSKNKISVVDPEYEKEKYNRDARKVNQVLNQCVTRLEKEVSAVFKNKSEKLEARLQSKSIQEQNDQIRKDNQEALVQIYKAKEQELDHKKR